MNARLSSSLSGLALLALAGTAVAQPRSVGVVFKESDSVGGGLISAINAPFTDGNGRMAALVNIDASRRVILDENLAIIFDSASVVGPTVTGGEGTIGFSNANGYIYSPTINLEDGVYSNGGILARGTELAPALSGVFSTFHSRPTMTPNGTAYWVAGTATTSTGATSQRVFYTNPTPATPATTSVVLKGGDVYGGLTVAAQGIAFDYAVSDNNVHRIHSLTATGVPTANDVYIAADNTVVAQEGFASPIAGANWTATMRLPSINNSGAWVFAGDTTAATASDEVIMSSVGLAMQEGTSVGGVVLSGTVNGLSINNNNEVLFTWGTGNNEVLCKGPLATLSADAQLLLRVGDLLDVTGDGVEDFTLIDLEASATIGPGLSLGDDGRVFVETTIRRIGGTSADDLEAILVLPFPGGGGGCNLADITEVGGTEENPGSPDGQLTVDDLILFVNLFSAGTGCPGTAPCNLADVTGIGGGGAAPDGELTVDDLIEFVNAFSAGC